MSIERTTQESGTNITGTGSSVRAVSPRITTPTLVTPTISSPSFTVGGVGVSELKRCTTQFDATSGTTGATLTNLTGLTGFTLTASGVYLFEIYLNGVATANSGMKIAFKYTTATLTSLECVAIGTTASAVVASHVTSTTDQASLLASTTAFIAARLAGQIVVNAGGTMAIQAAQNASHADTTSIYAGSWARLYRIA